MENSEPSPAAKRGAWGEAVAARWLQDAGFELLHTNWRSGRYELDIVARRGDVLHFVEVKARRAGALTTPEEAVTPAKFRALQRAAEAYIAAYGVNLEVQFDAIAVEYGDRCHEVRYIPNAMVSRW